MALTNAERQAQGRTHDIAAPSLGLGRFSADVETLGKILLKGVLKCRRTTRLVRMGGAAADNQTNYDRPRHDDHAERYDASNQQLSPQRHVHSLAPVAREDYHISAGRKSSLRRFCSPAWVAPSTRRFDPQRTFRPLSLPTSRSCANRCGGGRSAPHPHPFIGGGPVPMCC